MNVTEIDMNASMDCSRCEHTIPTDETALGGSLLASSLIMDNCPEANHNHQHVCVDKNKKKKELLLELGCGDVEFDVETEDESFNLTSFLKNFKEEGDDFLKDVSDISLDEDSEKFSLEPDRPEDVQIEDHNIIANEFKAAIEKRDSQIQLLMKSLESLTHEKEEKERKSIELCEKIESLEAALCDATKIVEFDRDQFGPAEFSSYLNLPENLHTEVKAQETKLKLIETAEAETQITSENVDASSQATISLSTVHIATQAQIPTADTFSETDAISTTSFAIQTDSPPACKECEIQTEVKQFIDACVQEEEKIPESKETGSQVSLPDQKIQEYCKNLLSTLASVRFDLSAVESEATESVDSLKSTFQHVIDGFELLKNNSASEILKLKQKYSKDIELQNEAQLKLQRELDELRFNNDVVIREKDEEILELKIKVAQLEFSKKSSEAKLVSFSSRLSPEGSELDVDISLSDSTNVQRSQPLRQYSIPEEEPRSEIYEITRTKMEYLAITPPLDLQDEEEGEEIHGTSQNSVIDDLKLQLLDLEKKYAANQRYLNEQTAEREHERDEFHRQSEKSDRKVEEMKKERDRFQDMVHNQKMELEDLDKRLYEAGELESMMRSKTEKLEDELKTAVDKIYQLREIIRDLEEQIDTSTVNVEELKEQNEFLREEVERLDQRLKELQDTMNTSHETFVTANSDFTTDELHAQVKELGDRLQKKLDELENFKWSSTVSRPSSSCSGSISTEDISIRESGHFDFNGLDLTAADVADGIRRLDVHFDNFVKFEEIMMKKMRDTEIRLAQTLKRQEELEIEKSATQEKLKEQLLKISDLESRMDELRFEPAPNTVTMGGLRQRIRVLGEELEEANSKLHLRTIELEDIREKMKVNQTMLAKANANKRVLDSFHTFSITTQTETFSKNVEVQTQVPLVARVDAFAQTGVDPFFPFESNELDISSIPGGPQIVHSTPNEQIFQRKQKSGFFKQNIENMSRENGSPEALRASKLENQKPEELSSISHVLEQTLVNAVTPQPKIISDVVIDDGNCVKVAEVIETENVQDVVNNDPAPILPRTPPPAATNRATVDESLNRSIEGHANIPSSIPAENGALSRTLPPSTQPPAGQPQSMPMSPPQGLPFGYAIQQSSPPPPALPNAISSPVNPNSPVSGQVQTDADKRPWWNSQDQQDFDRQMAMMDEDSFRHDNLPTNQPVSDQVQTASDRRPFNRQRAVMDEGSFTDNPRTEAQTASPSRTPAPTTGLNQSPAPNTNNSQQRTATPSTTSPSQNIANPNGPISPERVEQRSQLENTRDSDSRNLSQEMRDLEGQGDSSGSLNRSDLLADQSSGLEGLREFLPQSQRGAASLPATSPTPPQPPQTFPFGSQPQQFNPALPNTTPLPVSGQGGTASLPPFCVDPNSVSARINQTPPPNMNNSQQHNTTPSSTSPSQDIANPNGLISPGNNGQGSNIRNSDPANFNLSDFMANTSGFEELDWKNRKQPPTSSTPPQPPQALPFGSQPQQFNPALPNTTPLPASGQGGTAALPPTCVDPNSVAAGINQPLPLNMNTYQQQATASTSTSPSPNINNLPPTGPISPGNNEQNCNREAKDKFIKETLANISGISEAMARYQGGGTLSPEASFALWTLFNQTPPNMNNSQQHNTSHSSTSSPSQNIANPNGPISPERVEQRSQLENTRDSDSRNLSQELRDFEGQGDRSGSPNRSDLLADQSSGLEGLREFLPQSQRGAASLPATSSTPPGNNKQNCNQEDKDKFIQEILADISGMDEAKKWYNDLMAGAPLSPETALALDKTFSQSSPSNTSDSQQDPRTPSNTSPLRNNPPLPTGPISTENNGQRSCLENGNQGNLRELGLLNQNQQPITQNQLAQLPPNNMQQNPPNNENIQDLVLRHMQNRQHLDLGPGYQNMVDQQLLENEARLRDFENMQNRQDPRNRQNQKERSTGDLFLLPTNSPPNLPFQPPQSTINQAQQNPLQPPQSTINQGQQNSLQPPSPQSNINQASQNADPRDAQIQLMYKAFDLMKKEKEALLKDKDSLAARLDFQLGRNQQVPISQVVYDANKKSVTKPDHPCIPQNEKDEELLRKINELKKIKEDLSVKFFSGGSCEARKTLLEAEQASSEAAKKLKKLEKEVEDKGVMLQAAHKNSMKGAKELNEALGNTGCQRESLENQLQAMKEQWMDEIKDGLNLEEEHNLLKDKLDKHIKEDEAMQAENRKLMEQLDCLRQVLLPEDPCPISSDMRNRMQGDTLELYLRAKSYRKALSWQKKYLYLVIDGYKGLLDQKEFRQANFLNNRIPLSPNTFGLIDTREPLTKLRICYKAVLATVRMKFMVKRWDGRSKRLAALGMDNTSIVSIPSTSGRPNQEHVSHSQQSRRVPMSGLSLSSLSGYRGQEVETVLTNYLRRIQSLECQVGGVLSIPPKRHSHKTK